MADSPITLVMMAGIPRPKTEGPHYEALKAYVREHGQPHPVLVDQDGVVWAGGTIVNVCCELGVAVITQVVADGVAAAIQELATRDLTVLEKADLVLAVHDDVSTKFVLGKGEKRSEMVSTWFKSVLGKTQGYSASQVEQYLRIARSTHDQRSQMTGAATLHHAIRILKARECLEPAPIPSETAPKSTHHEESALEAAATFMEAFSRVDSWTTESLEMLRSLRNALNAILRAQRDAIRCEK